MRCVCICDSGQAWRTAKLMGSREGVGVLFAIEGVLHDLRVTADDIVSLTIINGGADGGFFDGHQIPKFHGINEFGL